MVILLAVMVAAVAGVVCLLRVRTADPAHRVNPYTATRVCLGMTQADVERVFGGPPGDYSSEMRGHHAEGVPDRPPRLRREDWTGDEGGAVVYFAEDGRVADYVLWIEPNYRPADGPRRFEHFRKWWYEYLVW
jgi:hypothetical protein